MGIVQKEVEKPRLAILYAYVLTYGGCIGFIIFFLIYFFSDDWQWIGYYTSPVVLAISIFLISCLGILTGNALLKRKKYGWILTQFFFIFLLLKSIYGLFFLPFFNHSSGLTGFQFLKYFIVIIITGLLLFYFNQKSALRYYGIELEDANRIYLISFLTSGIITALALVLNF